MNDLDFILNNPADFDLAMQSRSCDITSEQVEKLNSAKNALVTKMQQLQAAKNQIAKNFSCCNQNEKKDLINQSKEIDLQIAKLKTEVTKSENELNEILLNIPNILESCVPQGSDESANIEISRFGTPKKFDFPVKSHDEIGVELGLLDFKKTSAICGARFASFKGDFAKLYRVLINFMIEHAQSFGYQECFMPSLVKESAMYNAGQFPKFKQDSFEVEGKFRLIPTSEVTLVNSLANTCFNKEELPIRLVSYSECFRLEAGSSGRDTKGIIRQHQFGKVELFSATTHKDSGQELEKMTQVTESLLQKLELPYRKMLLCTGDTGFCSQKTYDIEVWIPSQNCYREISSCSNCGSFQARRMNAKYIDRPGKKQLIHTLNGSCTAVGRMMVAIIENFQNLNSSINIPKALVKWFTKPWIGLE